MSNGCVGVRERPGTERTQVDEKGNLKIWFPAVIPTSLTTARTRKDIFTQSPTRSARKILLCNNSYNYYVRCLLFPSFYFFFFPGLFHFIVKNMLVLFH